MKKNKKKKNEENGTKCMKLIFVKIKEYNNKVVVAVVKK